MAVEKYCTTMYGSNLWDLTSNEADMMISARRTGNKLAWNVSCGCHTYLVNEVLIPGVPNLEVSLLGRFVGFFRSTAQVTRWW